MDPTNETHDARTNAIERQTRRTILQALAASGSVAALGGVASAQDGEDDGAMDETTDGAEDVPVAGDFPEGETVGLRQVAGDLPAPTDLDYVEVDGEPYHFITTQTGQIFVTNLHEQADVDDANDDAEADPDDDTPDGEGTDGEEDETEAMDEDEDDPQPEDESDEPAADGADTTEGEADATEFVFNGVIPAWFGMEPDEIDEVENPTLELTAGETYTITWENGDGQPHNFVILDETDTIIERTEIMSEAGERQSLEFEATEEMYRYVCEVHPGTMAGRIQVTDSEEDVSEDEEPAESDETDALTPADMDLFLDIEDQIVNLGIGELGDYDERGLLGIAFHPEFAENRRFYVRYSAPERDGLGYNHTDVLAEFQADENMAVDPESERTIMEIPQPQDNHNGGALDFGPDGYLYTSVGDGGNVHDIGIGHVEDWYPENEGGNAQNTRENLLGGVLRIDVDAEGEETEYGIPEDNPLVGEEDQLEEFYAWGFRNPWGMAFDDDGTLFVADAGQHRIESVYVVESGGNYSWNVKEGSFCFSPDSPLDPPTECPDEVGEDAGPGRVGEPLRDPIAEYQHMRVSEAFIDSSVVVGGHRYGGEAISELDGAFVFGNWSSEGVATADGEVLTAIDPGTNGANGTEDGGENGADDERWDLEELQFEGADDESMNRYVYSVERDEEGELYVLANTDFRPFPETGQIYKIVPAEEGESVPEPDDAYVVPGDEDPEEEDPDDVDEEGEAFPDGEDEGENGAEPEAAEDPDAEAAEPDDETVSQEDED